ncbi:MAG TPA: FtsX-like permease family protein [Micromonosporaceae bacterium]|nr:FtsX-like permease family protein [Micromonosporaceae bacterium]
MTATLLKLAFAGLRARLLATTLTIVIGAAAAATLVIALEVRATGVDPWQRSFDAAHGAHVLVTSSSLADAQAVARLPGVAERDDPVPSALGQATIGGHAEPLILAGLGTRPTINVPVRIEGAVHPGAGVVLERSFADALHITVGSTIAIAAPTGTVRLTVVGTAISPSQARYPRSNPGVGWVSRATLQRIQPDQQRWSWSQAVRLTDPATAPRFAQAAAAALPPAPDGGRTILSWQDQRDVALMDSQPIIVVVGMFTILLLTVVFAVIGILTAARVAAQCRDIGLLKAIGLTPRQVSTVFLAESGALGLAAVVVGCPVGAVLAPRLAAPSAQTLIGSPTIAIQPWHALVASAIVVPVLLFSAYLAVRRTTRSTTLGAMLAGVPLPVTRGRIARLVGRVPLPLTAALGVRDLLARRRRTFWTATAVAVTGTVIVATLQMRAAIDHPAGTVTDVPTELSELVYSLDVVLIVIAVTSLVAVMLLSVRERIRDLGVLKAIGLTPHQITSSLVSANALLSAAAGLLSIPLGIGLYLAVLNMTNGTTRGAVFAPWWHVALIPFAVPAVVAAATSLPARLATAIPVNQAIRYE